MARQVLNQTNLHGFNDARRLPLTPSVGVKGYWVDKTDYSARTQRFNTNVNIGTKNPTKCIFIGGFFRTLQKASTGFSYGLNPTIFFKSIDPNSPRNDEGRLFYFYEVNDKITTPETLVLGLTLARVPNNDNANLYSQYRSAQIIGPGSGGFNDTVDLGNIAIPISFETLSYMTINDAVIRSYDTIISSTRDSAHAGTSVSSSQIIVKAGEAAFIYSVAVNSKSTPNWTTVKNSIDSQYYTWTELNLNSDTDAGFNDSGTQFSSSLVFFSPAQTSTILFDPTWSGSPYHMTAITVYG